MSYLGAHQHDEDLFDEAFVGKKFDFDLEYYFGFDDFDYFGRLDRFRVRLGTLYHLWDFHDLDHPYWTLPPLGWLLTTWTKRRMDRREFL